MRAARLLTVTLCLVAGCGGTPAPTPTDATAPDAAQPDAPPVDSGVDTAQPDAMQPDAAQPDASQPEVAVDASMPDAPSPDVAVDAPQPDAPQADVDLDVAQPDVPVVDVAADAPDVALPDVPPDVAADASDDRADVTTLDAARDVTSPDATLDASADVADATMDRADAAADRVDAAADRADAPVDQPDAATGPRVDRTNPQLYSISFRANEADPMARRALGMQPAFLDTRVAPRGQLVVYLHGAGAPTTCGSTEHERLLSSWGFHVLGPCYVSDYGVGNCGNDIRGCRLEAFEGIDRHPFVAISPPDSIETRVVRALELLQRRNPAGDWGWFIEGGRPRWGSIIISGASHGASSSGVIAQVRPVLRAVMLSGPLDTNQPWLTGASLSPLDRYWGFTHMADPQHNGHVAAFAAMRLPGALTFVDSAASPWGGTHRLASAATTTDGHGATQAGGSSPRDAMGRYRYEPVWRRMYGVTP